MFEELKNRQKQVLRGIVCHYIHTASPVGSGHLMNGYGLNCSSATIRNDMVALEEMGYIQQPHTSAGRVPTDKGYRYYVDHLMVEEYLESYEKILIQDQLNSTQGDLNKLLNQVSQLLGNISKELGVVLTPYVSWSIFDRLELIELTSRKVLVVIHIHNRAVKTVVMEVDTDLSAHELQKTAAYLNERLSGLSIQEVKDVLNKRMIDFYESSRTRLLMQRVQDAAEILFDFSGNTTVHLFGAKNIMMQPEFSDAKILSPVFSLVEDQHALSNLLTCDDGKPNVTIGIENGKNELRHFSVIKANFNMGKGSGTIGLIGPTRMRYRNLFPLVQYMTQTMSVLLS